MHISKRIWSLRNCKTEDTSKLSGLQASVYRMNGNLLYSHDVVLLQNSYRGRGGTALSVSKHHCCVFCSSSSLPRGKEATTCSARTSTALGRLTSGWGQPPLSTSPAANRCSLSDSGQMHPHYRNHDREHYQDTHIYTYTYTCRHVCKYVCI